MHVRNDAFVCEISVKSGPIGSNKLVQYHTTFLKSNCYCWVITLQRPEIDIRSSLKTFPNVFGTLKFTLKTGHFLTIWDHLAFTKCLKLGILTTF